MNVESGAARVGAGVLSLLGVAFLVPNVGRLATGTGPLAALALAALGTVLALVVVGAGGFLVRHGFAPEHVLRIVGWAALGNVVLGLVLGLGLLAEASFPPYAAATLLSVSTFAHVLIGVRDVQRIRAEDVARQREKLAVLNRLVRHNLRHEAQRLVYVGSELPGAADEGRRRELADDIDEVVAEISDMNDRLARSRAMIRRDATLDAGVDLGTLVSGVVAEHRERFPDAVFEVSVPSDCHVAGGDHLRHALAELVENAVEHTDGTAHVTVEATAADGQVAIRVRDDGPGIPEPDRSVITREKDVSQLTHSRGLGLWFVRWVMDAYGGGFRLDSGDEGTTVELRVPRARPGA